MRKFLNCIHHHDHYLPSTADLALNDHKSVLQIPSENPEIVASLESLKSFLFQQFLHLPHLSYVVC